MYNYNITVVVTTKILMNKLCMQFTCHITITTMNRKHMPAQLTTTTTTTITCHIVLLGL